MATVLLPYLDQGATGSSGQADLGEVVLWDELLARGAGAELTFERVPFDHPLWVLYSSGTTGLGPNALRTFRQRLPIRSDAIKI